jgi:hypothetical protein
MMWHLLKISVIIYQPNNKNDENNTFYNDQSAYAKYLYGDMPSAKGSTMEDNIQREKDNYRYTLY